MSRTAHVSSTATGGSARGRIGRAWKPALFIAGLLLAAFFLMVYRQVLYTVQKPSWPPPPDAITSAGARAATEEFAGRSRPRVADVGLHYAWSTAATIEPHVEGREFFPRIFADVRAARSSVHILMFGWREGEVGTDMADLLVQKLGQGVEVRIIVDGYGSRPFGEAKPMFARLAEAGAQIVVNDIFPWDEDGLWPDQRQIDWRQDEIGRADHRKLYVIDGNVSWTGGAGLEDHFETGGFHDVMVRVTGDVVRQAQAIFLTSFRSHGGPLPDDLARYFPAQPEAGRTPTAVLQVVPGGFMSATQAIRGQIDGAQRRLDIMNPYLSDKDMIERILAAARRGVKVRVVVSEKSNNEPAAQALKHRYGDLLAAGVDLREYPGAVVHAKVVVADDVVSFGTVNFDSWALYRNAEVAMIARSAAAADLFEERLFEPDVARSKRAQPPDATVKPWLWDKLAYFL